MDTGPLVAILSERDQYHDICIEALKNISLPIFTCLPVVTEAAWLLRKDTNALSNLFNSFGGAFLELLPIETDAMVWIKQVLERNRYTSPQLADACLMYLIENEKIDCVFTLDRRDFTAFKYEYDKSFDLLPET